MDSGQVITFRLVIDSGLHEVPDDYFVSEISFQERQELFNSEEIFIILQVDAVFAPDSLDDLEFLKLLILEIRGEKVQKGRSEAWQKVFGWILLFSNSLSFRVV
jgi:hypothetical protein